MSSSFLQDRVNYHSHFVNRFSRQVFGQFYGLSPSELLTFPDCCLKDISWLVCLLRLLSLFWLLPVALFGFHSSDFLLGCCGFSSCHYNHYSFSGVVSEGLVSSLSQSSNSIVFRFCGCRSCLALILGSSLLLV